MLELPDSNQYPSLTPDTLQFETGRTNGNTRTLPVQANEVGVQR